MISIKLYNYIRLFVALSILILPFSCTRDLDELEPATFPTNANVFIDGFSDGLAYDAFGGSKVTAFQVDEEVSYQGTASMRFEVPDFEDPAGAYAGGAFTTEVGRDLTGYDALTFWAKASKAATIDEIGFGNDLEDAKYLVILPGIAVNTNWKKYVIPIPDASKLTEERGMLYYSEAPENGLGYTFWLDEVKFERLGTLAHPKAAIVGGADTTITAETGDRISVGGALVTHNLPSGIDQTTIASPAYLTLFSSDQSVATTNDIGQAIILDQGETVITAQLGDIDATGSVTIQASGEAILPPGPAPAPTQDQDSVISMFSNVYQDVVVDTWNPFWEFSTAEVQDIKIGNDDVKRYKNLNFVGILTEAEKIDASQMTHFHMDIWTPDATALPATFKILLVDFGADGSFGGDDDSSHELSFTSPTLSTESWVSLDIPLSDFIGLTNRNQIAQLVLSGDLPNLFVDNVYYYKSGEVVSSGPQMAAPTPTEDAANVVSLYSNAYTDVPVDTWSAEWDEAEVADVQVAGDDVKLYTGLSFAGIEFTSQTVDASMMDRFHMDIWTKDPTAAPAVFKIKLVDFGADGMFEGGDDVEHEITLDATTNPAIASNTWVGLDIALSDFTGLTTRGHLAQLIISGDPNTVYVDNIYFYSGGSTGNPTEPIVAAPNPAQNEADVISLFSEAYTDVPVDTWRTEWSEADFEDVMIAGNAVKKYSALNFVGIETVANTIDASNMTHVHVDVWSPDFTEFKFKLVDFGADGMFDGGDDVEHEVVFPTPQQGQWLSLDIPLADFTGLTTKSNLAQYIFTGQPTGMTTVFIDNLYFYKEEGLTTEPTQAAPTPSFPEAEVISVFSDAYTNIAGTNYNPDWGQQTAFSEIQIEGNNTLLYSGFNYQGTELGTAQDVSGMNFLHLDFWSANAEVLRVFIISPGPVETPYVLSVPTSGWVSIDIPLSDFAPVDLTNVIQLKFDNQDTGSGDIYLDNIFFRQ